MTNKKFHLQQHPGAAYLKLPDYPEQLAPGEIAIANSVDIHSLIEDFDGPRLCLDFDQAGRLIGIEIVYSGDEYD